MYLYILLILILILLLLTLFIVYASHLDVLAEASEAAVVIAFAMAIVSELKVELLLEFTRLETAVESSSVRERTWTPMIKNSKKKGIGNKER
jgi:hypothetical protein